ncbi:F-box/WD repeat-containing protein 5 isoform X2 [Stomoxys calcitrans]|nr:F-box/WD repeat-containing protein 5 isoform X2 [Stomoxys calcitrans]XP_013115248.1 F-box/WD repeat-containing protein 5 isoform X2 [Stomoxys calcitrans]XP_013115249.1 F-box/WD repeat-containing protein 5 isoform X2 [Stomoxys calcitrans]XP_013115250.1 F-box/WD repeat-containing protein 5 isoform X2 [Stomoxys calcitrans]XP_013115251.1 F-box/WD repeat-containing protein 5 isoform X2 [Stomoxys calcitrans]XP_013115252.1 F-box/WD repeat-containing protein 5 isoform X2 [Stomoxys calcitrans]XP_01
MTEDNKAKKQKMFIEDEDEGSESLWWSMPDPVLIKVFALLEPKDILSASATCRRWYEVANDTILWKHQFQQHFSTDPSIPLKPGASSWKDEYARLTSRIPFVQTERLQGHAHQVLHVSFSHNGEMFATCSKDGYVIIWNSDHPCTERYSHNMKQFSWKYTQYSQFNQSDTLLLVSGVHFGAPHSTSGEIVVFTVGGDYSHLRCRVRNRPYDIFGTWFSDQYLISGELHWLAHLVSTSVLWLNKANQEVDSEHVPIMNQLYKFYNRNASSVRAIMMAKCPWLDETNDPLAEEPSSADNEDVDMKQNSPAIDSVDGGSAGNPLSHITSVRHSVEQNSSNDAMASTSRHRQTKSTDDISIYFADEYRRRFNGDNCPLDYEEEGDDVEVDDVAEAVEEYDDMENSIPKYLIFSTGSKTYTPHQIGIKRINHVTFPKKLDPGPSLKERVAARKERNQMRDPDPDWNNYESVSDRFDKIDKVIDLHGHIIGMALSPDHRYLYVNTRPWPQDYVISNPLEPPPIAQEIDIHVIDLMTLKRVGNMLRAHKAYTPSNECFFIFLDVCDDYVASGAEDMHAYLWDRYYGISLAKYKHTDVVNSVAFNPKDSQMLVTTSDDYSIKIWRSRAVAKKLKIDMTNNDEAFDLKLNTTAS